MNLENLPQPPEGMLSPGVPWYKGNLVERQWDLLKSALIGRNVTGDPSVSNDFPSSVYITEADADRLIENLKKDPRGYPIFNSNDSGEDFYQRHREFLLWLVEEYLEKPFRKKVDKKIEDAEREARLREILESRKQENIKPQEPLIPALPKEEPLPPEPQVELVPEIPKPTAEKQEPKKPKQIIIKDSDLVKIKGMPSNVSKAMTKYGRSLSAIGNQLSRQNSILTRRLGLLRRIDEDLDDTKFLLEQIGENYQEALDDFESEERKKELRKKIVAKITSPFANIREKKEPQVSKVSQETPDKPWWKFWDNKPETPKKLASGGISTGGVGGGKIIEPGIYDNPVRGQLPPGMAVVPLNRNYGKDILGQYDNVKFQQALGEVLSKPTSALLGAAVSVYGSILRGLGPLAGYFNHSIPGMLSTVSSILKIPRSAVIDMFGGSNYAGTSKNEKELKTFYASWRKYLDDKGLHFPGEFSLTIDSSIGAGEGQDSGGGVESTGGLDRSVSSLNPFGDTDGEETGIDIALRGKGTNGYGRGLIIRNPWNNLYYFEKVPAGFSRAGMPTRGINGSAERNKVSGFGHWATYYIKDSDGSWYELLIGHLDKPAPTWNDTGSGVKLNQGVKIGIQGASGSTSGGTPDGTFDHMTTHINSMNRRNPSRSGQLLLQWARDLSSYKSPQQPSLQSGGFVRTISNLLSNFRKPQGLRIRGVQAGFTGMSRQGFDAIMGGDKFRLGKWKPQILGRGAYSAPTLKGAERYAGTHGSLGGRQLPGGVVKTIVPGNARRINIIEPQAAVKPATFDRGKILADKLIRGEYSNSPLANRLRQELFTGVSKNIGIGFVKTFGRVLGVLNAPLIGDMIFPEPTANGTLDYARSQGLLQTPQSTKPNPKSTTIQMPSSSMISPGSQPASKRQFINVDIPTNTVLTTTQMRRM